MANDGCSENEDGRRRRMNRGFGRGLLQLGFQRSWRKTAGVMKGFLLKFEGLNKRLGR